MDVSRLRPGRTGLQSFAGPTDRGLIKSQTDSRNHSSSAWEGPEDIIIIMGKFAAVMALCWWIFIFERFAKRHFSF